MLHEGTILAARIAVSVPKPRRAGARSSPGPSAPLDLEVRLHKESGLWVASCDLACVAANGITREDALQNLSRSKIGRASCRERV